MHDEYEETNLIIKIASQIVEDSSSVIEKIFNNSLIDLVKYKSKIGTIAHICIYLREIEFLRKIVTRFDEPKELYEWLCEKDSNNLTPSDLVLRFDYSEFTILFETIGKKMISSKNNELVLKKGILDKYTNIMNGFRPRFVILTTKSMSYGKKESSELVKIPLKDVKLEYTDDLKKIKLIPFHSELEYIFKDINRESLSDWINLLKNVMPNRDRTFYYNSFFYKLISDLVKVKDYNIYEIMKSNETLTYYLTQENYKPSESSIMESQVVNEATEQKEEALENMQEEVEIEEKVEDNKSTEKKSLIPTTKNKTEDEGLEMFSFESESEEDYKFYEAKE